MDIDWTAIITALIAGLSAGIPATIIAWRSSRKINGHLQQFIDAQEGKIASDAVIREKNEEGVRRVARQVAADATAVRTEAARGRGKTK